ncbi:MAG: YceI family protein [Bryobacteraceae bacterium]|nr:YceI family protein [Bryobacteraceae bacterium]
MRNALVYCLLASSLGAADLRQLRVAPAAGNRFALEVEKTGLLSGKKHLFLFERYSGTLQLDPAAPEKSSIQLEIEARSAILKDDWVSASDAKKIADYAQMKMMDSAKYPLLKFASTGISARGNGVYEVRGNLTIRDVTKPVLVMVTEKGGVCEGKAAVKLSDFKLKPAGALLGAIGTKDEMTVSFLLRPGA